MSSPAGTATLPASTPTTRGLSRDERAVLRARQARRRRRIAWIVVLMVLVLGGAGVYVVRFTAVLGLTAVTVQGASGDVGGQVRSRAPATDGTPLITIDLDQVRQDILEVPRIATATVARNWPDTLVVTVTTRVPAAIVSANDSWWLLDAQGLPYDSATEQEVATSGLPTLRLATPGAGDPATLAALSVAAALPTDLPAEVATISARTPYDISLELADGRLVQWGEPGEAQQKIQVLRAILNQPGTNFDISDPDLITVN